LPAWGAHPPGKSANITLTMYHTAPCGKIISSTPETRYFLLTWSDGVHLTSIFQEHPAQIAMATWIIILPLARLPATMGSTSLTVLTYHSSSSAKCAAATLYYKPALPDTRRVQCSIRCYSVPQGHHIRVRWGL
jgi:hypothetical protein